MRVLYCSLLFLILNTLQHVHSQQIRISLERGTSGRVMIRLYNTLGVVCSDHFTSKDAEVICGSISGAQRYNGHISSESISGSKVWLTRLGCVGNEQQIDQCPVSGWDPGSCPSGRAAAVQCRTSVTQRPTYVYPRTTTQSSSTAFRVALQGGSNSRSGRLVVYWYGQPGGVCANNFETIDAVVVCRMLGYSTSRATVVQYQQTDSKLWLENVQCRGNEASLRDCVVSWSPRTCPRNQQAGVSCTNNVQPPATTLAPSNTFRVELQGGSSSRSGRLVAFVNGQPGEVCANNFDYQDARVVCRMLGYTQDGAQYQVYAKSTSRVWFTDVNCRGDETSLQSCSINWSPRNCNQVVAVTCGGYVPPTTTTLAPSNTFRVELQGGSSSRSGRLVAFVNGQPGEVCANNFDYQDARVVCRMLGYTQDGAQYQVYAKSTSRVWFTDVNCRGDETSLQSCSMNWSPRNCNQVVGVTCGGYVPPTALPTQPSNIFRVELQGGSSSRNGRLVVFYNGQPGEVCANNFDYQDARVICRMLGYIQDGAQFQVYAKSTRVWFTDVNCRGDETSLQSCSIGGWFPTNCNQVVGVTCGGYVPPTRPVTTSRPVVTSRAPTTTWRIELRGGSDSRSGRLIVYYYGQEGTVCSQNFDSQDAKVVCRMLGYSTDRSQVQLYSRGTGTVWFTDVNCRGDETSIRDCSIGSWNPTNCNQVVGVRCGGYVPPTNPPVTSGPGGLQVRLEGGPDRLHGILTLRRGSDIRTVCLDSFRQNEVNVVCRMLGAQSSSGKLLSHVYGPGPGLVSQSVYTCQGYETSLDNCQRRAVTQTCGHTQDVSMGCGTLLNGQQPVRVTLVGGPSAREGRVEVTYYGQTGTVCANGFDNQDARVVCRMLGYTSSQGIAVLGSLYGAGSGALPVLLDRVGCSGNEQTLDQCRNEGWRKSYCSHSQDVSIRCGSSYTVPPPATNQVYLVDGPDRLHGRVVIRHNNVNGTVCDDQFDDNDAKVICRMLGYYGSGARAAGSYFGEGPPEMKVWLSDLQCTGSERDLSNCRNTRWGTNSCGHHEDVSVLCGPRAPSGQTVRVYLVDGPDRWHGRLVVEHEYQNGTVCDDRFGEKEATVVCHSLGYWGSGITKTNQYTAGRGGRVWLDEVMCVGNEASIGDCFHDPWGQTDCQHSEDIGVNCGPTGSGTREPPRPTRFLPAYSTTLGPVLGGGMRMRLDSDSRVIITIFDTTGTICSHGFDISDARVICRNLNLPDFDVRTVTLRHTVSSVYLVTDLRCTGLERSLSSCPYTGGNTVPYCQTSQDVGVVCGGYRPPVDQPTQPSVSGTSPGPGATCGTRYSSKILGGTVASLGTWPWLASLQLTIDRTNFCGAAVIAPQWVITAGHCAYPILSILSSVQVVVGTNNLNQGGVRVGVSRITIHPRFSRTTYENDVALIRLQRPLTYSTTIRPICLNTVSGIPSTECYVAGWGGTRADGNATTLLRSASIPIVPDSRCSQFALFNSQVMLCAGVQGGTRDVCAGDSGGPLMCRRPGSSVYDLWGTVTGGEPCGVSSSTYGVYADVAQYGTWINTIINSG